MLIKKILIFSFIIFSFYGCTAIKITQESIEKIKTTSTSGFQNGIKPESIRNVKDFIVDENDFVIIAEAKRHTLYEIRNESNMGRLSVLNDLMDYCLDIKGTPEFGKQMFSSMSGEYDSTDFEFSSIKSDYKKYKKLAYKGWMKCLNTNDNFEVKRKRRTKYFLITHDKEQLQGYALQWYIDYFNLKDLDVKGLNLGVWSYSSLVQFSGFCDVNKGKILISNRYTNNTSISMNLYLLQRFNPTSSSNGFILASGTLECRNSTDKKSDFIYDISFSKKYRKLLYTKRLNNTTD
ncbi:hypothetical protein JHD50_04025 [Sulfurimonas sp. MAG313]|nr:hypothetical protein [Sulfurimonas sp. MAG313]MDF1880478.1 hypothetical protein [Sulfurimonas sp. MAG313]